MLKISAITRTKGRPQFLRRAAASIAAAGGDGIEWIIVEDEPSLSRDVESVAESFRRDTGMSCSIATSGGLGRAAAANRGLELASGSYFHLHDDDDTIKPQFYNAVLDAFAENPTVHGIAVGCTRVDEIYDGRNIDQVRERLHYPERKIISLEKLAEVFSTPPISLVLKTDHLQRIGGFDDRFDVGEDYEMMLRFLRDANVIKIGDVLCKFHHRSNVEGSSANSTNPVDFYLQDRIFLDKLFLNDELGLREIVQKARKNRESESIFEKSSQALQRLRAVLEWRIEKILK